MEIHRPVWPIRLLPFNDHDQSVAFGKLRVVFNMYYFTVGDVGDVSILFQRLQNLFITSPLRFFSVIPGTRFAAYLACQGSGHPCRAEYALDLYSLNLNGSKPFKGVEIKNPL